MADEQQNQPNADSIRSSIFKNAKNFKSERVKLFGEEVEVRQPKMKDILSADADGEDSGRRMARMIVMHTYVPGTNQKVFENAHIDEILDLPFGGGIQELNNALNRLMGIDVETEQGNSEGTGTGST